MVRHDKQFLPVLVWGFLQIAILGIGASGYPLWAHHPFPRESLALEEMLAGQTLIFALFAPVLVLNPWQFAIAVALMMPADALAGLMSNAPHLRIWLGYGCVALWMAGLTGLGLVLKPRGHLAVSAGATLLAAGGGLFDYLRWESTATTGQAAAFLPISLLPKLCAAVNTDSDLPWIQAGVPLIILSITLIIRLSITTRLRPSTSLHPTS